MKTINSYRVLKELYSSGCMTVFLVEEPQERECRVIRFTDESVDVENWNDLYYRYTNNVANYNFLPRWLNVDGMGTNNFAVFEGFKGGMLELEFLSPEQIEQLLDAVSHLHKKKFVHGGLTKENLWIKEDGNLVLYGAGEYEVLNPEQKISYQMDIEQLISLIKENSDLNTENLDPGLINNLSMIYDWLESAISVDTEQEDIVEGEDAEEVEPFPEAEPERKPELVEKSELVESADPIEEKKEYTVGVPEKVDSANEIFAPLPVNLNKKKYRFLTALLSGVSILLLGLVIYTLFLGAAFDEKDEASISVEADSAEGPDDTGAEEFAEVFPGWKIIKQAPLFADNSEMILLGAARKEEDQAGRVKLAVLTAENDDWKILWESEEFQSELDNAESFIDEFVSFYSPENEKGLWAVELVGNESLSLSNILVFSIEKGGKIEAVAEELGFGVILENETLKLEKIGELRFSLQEGELVQKELQRSELAPAPSVEATFILDEHFRASSFGEDIIYLKKGEILAIIPADEDAKKTFNMGEIKIYSDFINPASNFVLSEEHLLAHGNSIKFDRTGQFKIVLSHYRDIDMDIDEPKSTLTVIVKD